MSWSAGCPQGLFLGERSAVWKIMWAAGKHREMTGIPHCLRQAGSLLPSAGSSARGWQQEDICNSIVSLRQKIPCCPFPQWGPFPLFLPLWVQHSPVIMSSLMLYINCVGTVWIKLAFLSQQWRVQWRIPDSKHIPTEICHRAARAREWDQHQKLLSFSPHLI